MMMYLNKIRKLREKKLHKENMPIKWLNAMKSAIMAV